MDVVSETFFGAMTCNWTPSHSRNRSTRTIFVRLRVSQADRASDSQVRRDSPILLLSASHLGTMFGGVCESGHTVQCESRIERLLEGLIAPVWRYLGVAHPYQDLQKLIILQLCVVKLLSVLTLV